MTITIVRRPIGEAPEWVRDAWIGLSLPTTQHARTWLGVGVLIGPRNVFADIWYLISGRTFRIRGYAVNARTAVDLLAQTQPAAAEWWRENTPNMLDGRQMFVFDADACEP